MDNTEDLGIHKYYKVFKENLGIIALFIYGIGFINNFIFYELLGIPIFNYIGLNDLIFFFLKYVFGIILILFVFHIALFTGYTFVLLLSKWLCIIFNKRYRKIFIHSKKHLNHFFTFHIFDKYINTTRFTVLTILLFLILFSPYKLILLPAYFIYFLYAIEQLDKQKTYKIAFNFSLAILVFFLLCNTIHDTYTKRYEKDNYEISFYEGDKYITTFKDCSHYNYLGETSTTIFIFDIKEKTTKIFNKENISQVEVKSPSFIDKITTFIKKSIIFEVYKDYREHNIKKSSN